MDSDIMYFGLDPVDFRHTDGKSYRFVSLFTIGFYGDDVESDKRLRVVVSWNNSLRFQRFLRCFPLLFFRESCIKVSSKLIRFDLQRYADKLGDFFPDILDWYGYTDISWNDLDDSGLIKLRSKKSKH